MTDEGLCRVGWSTPRATHELGKILQKYVNFFNIFSQARITLDLDLEVRERSLTAVNLMTTGR